MGPCQKRSLFLAACRSLVTLSHAVRLSRRIDRRLGHVLGGCRETGSRLQTFWRGGEEANTVVALVMGATDAFLFGVVLLIFAGSITFGFVLTIVPQRKETLLNYMVDKAELLL